MALATLRRLTSQENQHRLSSLSFLSNSPISRPSSTKKVTDRIVLLSTIDFKGKKHNVIGLAGQTLLKALINTGLVDPYSHRLEEIDACSAHCEVNIAQEWLDKLPPRSYDEEYVLKHNSRARVLNKHSRFGCQVLLDHDLQDKVSVNDVAGIPGVDVDGVCGNFNLEMGLNTFGNMLDSKRILRWKL